MNFNNYSIEFNHIVIKAAYTSKSMSNRLFFLTLLSLFADQSGCNVTFGYCPRVVPTLVDEETLGGRWFEIEVANMVKGGRKMTCSFVDFDISNIGFGMRLRMNRSQIFPSSAVRSTVINGLQIPSLSQSPHGAFVVEYPGDKVPYEDSPNFHVLHLDEESCLLYYCNYNYFLTSNFAWILARNRTLDHDKVTLLKRKLEFNQAQVGHFSRVRQKDCEEKFSEKDI
ncbi:uncharacterized protein LOC134855538 [Symsagittifera roscoffensis]|uniref:uncharacterized protein LOC134855538 n=1 Tax=Symsagittifera roscoffensis TaxID=84072 RepID=UPI00307BA381